MILNAANLSTLFTGYKANFQSAFAQAMPEWPKIATEVPSSTEQNLYAWLGQFPRMREWLGDRVIKNVATSNYTVINKQFEATVGVPVNKVKDDTYGVFSPLMSEMGYGAKLHPDEVLFALLAAGASNLCYDGQYFFDTDHPVVVSGSATTASNYDATGGGALWCLLDTKRPLKPMVYQNREPYNFMALTSTESENVVMRKEYLYGVDGRMAGAFGLWQLAYGSLNILNGTNFDAAVTAMMGFKSDEDRPLGVRPNLLVCGPSNRAAARNLILKEFLAGGENNPNFKEVDILVSPYFT